jgi:hypothetical protein
MIEYLPGRKAPGDKRVLWNGEQVKFSQIAEIVVVLCHNEDIIYPKPRYRGGQMLIDLLQEAYDNNGVSDELLKKYKLNR